MTRTAGHSHEVYSKVELRIVMLCSMAGTLMQALDSTIANVALPYMQGSLAASRDQITWVLTSYIVAAAIMTAPVGWMAARFGRKNFALVSLAGFTVASMMCGAAQTLNEMIDNLKGMALQTRGAASNLNSAAAEIVAATQQQASSTKEQAATVQTTATQANASRSFMPHPVTGPYSRPP